MSDYLPGILIGFVVAGVLGFAFSRIRQWQKQWTAMTKPQKGEVATKKGELVSKKTPWEVVVSGVKGGCLIVVMLLLFAVVVWLLLGAPT